MKVTLDDVFDALESVVWYNGYQDVIEGWKDLPRSFESGWILSPKLDEQAEVLWMIAVCLFGDYGTSPRSGWIEDVDGLYDFIDRLKGADDGH